MQEWWHSLDGFEQIFWYIALPFSLILFIQMILTFIGIGSEGSSDAGDFHDGSLIDADGDGTPDFHETGDPTAGFHFFTLRNFIAFFTIFGWTGIAAINNGAGNFLTLVLAFIGGLIAMFIVAGLFYFISRMAESGNLNIKNAINTTGTVYLPLKARAAGKGKVNANVQGALREFEAITNGNEDLPTGTTVKITGIIGNNVLIVEKYYE